MQNSETDAKTVGSKKSKVVGKKPKVVRKKTKGGGAPRDGGKGSATEVASGAGAGVERGIIAQGVRRGARYSGTLAAGGRTVEPASNLELERRTRQAVTAQKAGGLAPKHGGNPPKAAMLGDAQLLAIATRQSLAGLMSGEIGGHLTTPHGVPYRLASVPRGARSVACQQAVALALQGKPVAEVWDAVRVAYAACGQPVPIAEEGVVNDMAGAALELGLARFVEEVAPGAPSPFEDAWLSEQLESALAADSRGVGSPIGQGPAVRVVKNLTDRSFGDDPLVATLIAWVAHRVVAEHLIAHPHVYSFGLAGGRHCATFVRNAGAESSPFPDASGNRKFTFVPLTREPVYRHQLPTANAVVGQMVAQARSLLGERRVDGVTLDRRERAAPIVGVAAEGDPYRDLDIAAFGCGDVEKDGWLERALRGVKLPEGAKPVTDLCLTVLDELGAPIPLPDDRDFDGIGLADVRRLASHTNRLALLLTSGAAKGRPLLAVARTGCVDTIVCDQAAARSALAALGFAKPDAQATGH